MAGPLPEEIAAQRAIVAAARAELDRAQLELDRTRVKARNAGVVQTREISAGDYLETADPVITVVDNRELEVFLELPEQLSGQVRAGKPVILTSRNLPEWKKEATITSVIPSAEAGSRRQLVRVSLDNPPEGLISGMAVRGELELNIDPNSIIVSRDALVRRGSRWLLFAVNEDNTAREVEVEIVADMGEKVAISSTELENGQQIVLRGGDGLRNGAPVRISLR
ncbi:MAG: efflux RND transporter periplasmic adaptor subunit [Prochloraceae cyanobacterium]